MKNIKKCLLVLVISFVTLGGVAAEIVSRNLDEFQGLRKYVVADLFKQVDVKTLAKSERLKASNKNKRAQFLEKVINQIDAQIEESIRLSKDCIEDENHRAYLVDEKNDKEALFINNIKNCGDIDFYRDGENIWIRCKLKNGKWLFYQYGPLFKELTNTEWLVISKGQEEYKASSDIGNMSDKMKKDDTYFKSQNIYFNKMWDDRSNLFKKYFVQ